MTAIDYPLVRDPAAFNLDAVTAEQRALPYVPRKGRRRANVNPLSWLRRDARSC